MYALYPKNGNGGIIDIICRGIYLLSKSILKFEIGQLVHKLELKLEEAGQIGFGYFDDIIKNLCYLSESISTLQKNIKKFCHQYLELAVDKAEKNINELPFMIP